MISAKTHNGAHLEFDPTSTALVMIDFQKAFMDDQSNLAMRGYDMTPAKHAASVAKPVLALARQHGLRVVHTREGYAPDLGDVNKPKLARGTVGTPGPLGRHLIRGEANQDIVDDLYPIPGEPVVDKPGFDGFFRSDLDAALHGVDGLIICGLTTECCVFSTIRSAVDRGFKVLTLVDACAGITQTAHNLTIQLLQQPQAQFGLTAVTEDVSFA
jgi:nicotinamidase-related amidase